MGFAIRLDQDCERGKVFILISWTIENTANRKKSVNNFWGAVLVREELRNDMLITRDTESGEHGFRWVFNKYQLNK